MSKQLSWDRIPRRELYLFWDVPVGNDVRMQVWNATVGPVMGTVWIRTGSPVWDQVRYHVRWRSRERGKWRLAAAYE